LRFTVGLPSRVDPGRRPDGSSKRDRRARVRPDFGEGNPVTSSATGRDGKFADMRRNLALAVSALILVSFAALAEEDIAGTYVGDYVNKAGKTGGYQLTFTPDPGGTRSARAASRQPLF